jgi:CheY-like chemotaxis protein
MGRHEVIRMDSERRPLVLIVDDHEDGRELSAELLELHRFRVVQAQDGPSALRLEAELGPDLVLLDLAMPGLDGIEVARRLRSTPRGARLAIVALTAFTQPEVLRRAIDAGCDEALIKPMEPEDLAAALRQALSRRRAAIAS